MGVKIRPLTHLRVSFCDSAAHFLSLTALPPRLQNQVPTPHLGQPGQICYIP